MPAMTTKLPTLSLLNNLSPALIGSDGCPKERQISRSILLDVSPDREELLFNNSIEDIRETLKLRVHSPHGHWLYCANRRREIKPPCADATTRYSLFNLSHNEENATEEHEATMRRPAHSGSRAYSSIVALPQDLKDLADIKIDTWSSRSLTTQDKLISPRPLGPTHILVISRHDYDRDPNSNSNTDDVLELQVNDLLFILNVPNLRTIRKNGQFAPVLPRRLHNEMPRVTLRVPSLETFPEVVVYLHTRDIAALFSKLVPEWIRGIVQPLKSAFASCAPASKTLPDAIALGCDTGVEHPGSQCLSSPLWFGPGFDVASSKAKHSIKRLLKPLYSILALRHPGSIKPDRSPDVAKVASPHDLPKTKNSQRCKSVAIAANEIAHAFSPLGLDVEKTDICSLDENECNLKISLDTHPSDHGFENNVLTLTAARLNALASNFTYLGYFERALWLELDMYRDIIAEALILTPKTCDRLKHDKSG